MVAFASIAALLALGATPPGPDSPSFIGERFGRDSILVTPAPVPPGRVDDARRPERCRVWVSNSPYGAASEAPPVLVRIGQTPIAIDSFTRIEGRGSLARLERARNVWLEEQGYVLHVRTHINEGTKPRARAEASVSVPTLPPPRATIRIEADEPHPRPARSRVNVCPKVVEPTISLSRAE